MTSWNPFNRQPGTEDDPIPEDEQGSVTEPVSEPEAETYDYTIDPLEGLPVIDPLDDEEPELRIGRKPVPDEDVDLIDPVVYRAAASDPIFGYLVALAVSFGLTPLLPDGVSMRYTVAWGVLAGFGVIAWLLGNLDRFGQEQPENLAWGVIIGVVTGTPLYMFGGATLSTTSKVLFESLTAGTLLAYLVFVMPLGETLFFRGVLQDNRGMWVVGGLATIWSALLFFPLIQDLRDFWAVTVFIGTTLAIVNVVYSWVRERNGLAAAWLCQIVVNMILIYLPFISQ